jgi:TetR/AcrR family transcriptional regulator, ethionamide resistance regulator
VRWPTGYLAGVPTKLGRRARQLSKGDEKEQKLLVVGERLLGASRFESTSVADIANLAGLSRPTFYFYFASKQALLASIIRVALAGIANELALALRDEGLPPGRRLAAAITAAADTWWEHRAVMNAAAGLATAAPELYDETLAMIAGVNSLCVELLLSHGTVPESHDRAAAEQLIATLALLNERTFSHAMREAKSRDDIRPYERTLVTIWERALGLPR